jgi:hypothetical protein
MLTPLVPDRQEPEARLRPGRHHRRADHIDARIAGLIDGKAGLAARALDGPDEEVSSSADAALLGVQPISPPVCAATQRVMLTDSGTRTGRPGVPYSLRDVTSLLPWAPRCGIAVPQAGRRDTPRAPQAPPAPPAPHRAAHSARATHVTSRHSGRSRARGGRAGMPRPRYRRRRAPAPLPGAVPPAVNGPDRQQPSDRAAQSFLKYLVSALCTRRLDHRHGCCETISEFSTAPARPGNEVINFQYGRLARAPRGARSRNGRRGRAWAGPDG